MKPRVIILFLSAAIIISLVQWRMNRENASLGQKNATPDLRRLAPRFELYDQHSQLVKFERYLGRTRVLLLFIAGASADVDPLIQTLTTNYAAIEDSGVQVIVVGTATPFAIREAEKRHGDKYPFPILTDIDQKTPEPAPTHRLWGLAIDGSEDFRQELFLIERDGTVAWTGNFPRPTADPAKTVEMIARGDWPTQ